MYGKFVAGVLYVSDQPLDGYKPMIETTAPKPQIGYEAGFFWIEEADQILQVWDEHPITEVETVEDKAEAYDILMGVAE